MTQIGRRPTPRKGPPKAASGGAGSQPGVPRPRPPRGAAAAPQTGAHAGAVPYPRTPRPSPAKKLFRPKHSGRSPLSSAPRFSSAFLPFFSVTHCLFPSAFSVFSAVRFLSLKSRKILFFGPALARQDKPQMPQMKCNGSGGARASATWMGRCSSAQSAPSAGSSLLLNEPCPEAGKYQAGHFGGRAACTAEDWRPDREGRLPWNP